MMSCNDANHSLGSPGQLTATVAAGQPITAYWNPWGHNIGPMVGGQSSGIVDISLLLRLLLWQAVEAVVALMPIPLS
jgi:hypothetical protein